MSAQIGEQSKWAAGDDFRFARTDRTPYDADHLRRVVLYPAMDRCRIEREKWKHGFHVFRHTAGSIVHAQTGDLKLAQELLGHSRIGNCSHFEPTMSSMFMMVSR